MGTNTVGPGPGILRYGRWPIVRYSLMLIALFGSTLLLWPGLLQNLFVETAYLAHGYCLAWQPALLWLHVASDSAIGLSYVGISITLAYLVHRARRDIPFQWIFLAFGLFIIACGSTHLMDVVTLWYPYYWFSGDLKLITAISSVATAVVLPPLVPRTLAMIRAAKESEQRKLQLEQANRDLEALTARLREMDELKTQFFANVSHELRTPLALTLGRTENLLSAPDLNDSHKHELQIVHRNARALLKQVNDLLDVSKLDAGKMQVVYNETDLARVVRRIVSNFDSLAKDRKISFTYVGLDSLPAEIDIEKIERILLNLLSNAFKFTPDGGLVVCALDKSDNKAAISVRDSGPGIKPEIRDAIFERFRQADGGTSRRFGGTGLGLAIVKDFAELHGGSVAVTDAPEGGAQFTVEIPLRAPHNPSRVARQTDLHDDREAEPFIEELRAKADVEQDPASAVESALTNAPLVLVVEDNRELRRFIVESLAGDYRIVTASEGREALSKATERRPDLVISDVMMPGMGGDELVRELRKRSEFDSTPIVLLTARADQQARVQALREGANEYIFKPFSVEELRVRARGLISIAKARRVLQDELETQSQDVEELAHEVAFRKRQLHSALESLRQSEARFRRLVDADIIGVITVNRDGHISDANDTFLNMLGYTHEQLEAGMLNTRKLTPPEWNTRNEHALSRLWARGAAEPWEKEYLRSDGSRVAVLVGAATLQPDGAEAIAFVIDQSERKRAEAELRESRERFRTLAEAIPHIVWSTLADGYCDYFNSRWTEYTGRGAEESFGTAWQESLHPEDRAEIAEVWNGAVANKTPYEVEYRLRGRNGEYRWFLTRGVPQRDDGGGVIRWFGTCTDIDEQKRSEQAKGYLAAIVESSDDVIVSKDLEGTITSWNNAAERVYGYTAAEAIGKPITLIAAPPGHDDIQHIMERVRNGQRVSHHQTQRMTKDGRRIHVSMTVSPIRDDKGTVLGASTIARDITEIRRTQQVLRNSEKLATVGRLAATIAHEINNPLEAVSNVLYLLGNQAGLNAESKQYVELAGQEVTRIAHIVRQTLAFHREAPEPVPVDLRQLSDDVLTLHSRKLRNSDIRVERRYDGAWPVSALPGEMRQVLTNLIGNAIEAMPHRGRLIVRLRAVRDWTNPERCGVRITIADTGSGISRGDKVHLFEPFFTTKGEKGTGLGLWVTRGIVAKHGGHIHVFSSTLPGRTGTTFTVFIPSEFSGPDADTVGQRNGIA